MAKMFKSEIGLDDLRSREDYLAMAVGHAVFRWSRLENCLFRLYVVVSKIDGLKAAEKYRRIKFHQWLELASTTIENDRRIGINNAYWKSLKKRIKQLNLKRNYIVYAGMIAHGHGSPKDLYPYELTPYVGPPVAEAILTRYDKHEILPMDANEVFELAQDFQECVDLLCNLEISLENDAVMMKCSESIAFRRQL